MTNISFSQSCDGINCYKIGFAPSINPDAVLLMETFVAQVGHMNISYNISVPGDIIGFDSNVAMESALAGDDCFIDVGLMLYFKEGELYMINALFDDENEGYTTNVIQGIISVINSVLDRLDSPVIYSYSNVLWSLVLFILGECC